MACEGADSPEAHYEAERKRENPQAWFKEKEREKQKRYNEAWDRRMREKGNRS